MNLEKQTFLRVLKGAPLSVLLALWVHGAMSRKELVRKTGWQKDTVDNALDFLSDLKLIERPHYRKWALSDGFHQLPFPSLEIAESRKNRLSEQSTIIVEPVDNFAEGRKNRLSASIRNGDDPAESRKNRLSPSSSSSYVLEEERRDGEEHEETATSTSSTSLSRSVQASDVFDLLRSAGVGEAMARKLAGRDYVTWDYAEGHLIYIRANGEPLRYALQRMKDGDGVPVLETAVEAIPAQYRDIVKR